jgi:hypothetical protein
MKWVEGKYIAENLGSLEKAKEYNKKAYACKAKYSKYGGACISSLACENCFYVISSSCACLGIGKCVNCGFESENMFKFILQSDIITDDYSI